MDVDMDVVMDVEIDAAVAANMDRERCGPLVEARNAPWSLT